jgi:regulator of ribonuclease activity A
LTEALFTACTADLCDRFGADARTGGADLRSYGGRDTARGLIATLQCREDAALLRMQLAEPGQGRILVVDGGGSLQAALLGERMAALALDRGWAGLVIHGAVRDVARLRSLDIAVLALGQVPRRGGRTGAGCTGTDLFFGGLWFRPGQYLCLDADGMVVLDHAPA